jgi:hypothetical protein
MRGDRVRSMPGRNHHAVAICGRTHRCAIERRSCDRSSNRCGVERSSNRCSLERSPHGRGIERSSGIRIRGSVGIRVRGRNRVHGPISVGFRVCRALGVGRDRERRRSDFLVRS